MAANESSLRTAEEDFKRWSEHVFENRNNPERLKEAKGILQQARESLEKAYKRQERIAAEKAHAAADEKAKGDITDSMPIIDKGWTADWLSEFCSKEIAPHHLPRLEELIEFIESELPVKITIPHLLCQKWIGKMKTPSSALLSKIFITSNTEPCVEFIFQIGNRVVNAVEPGVTEMSFISFWDDMICNVLNFVLSDIGKSDRYSTNLSSTGSNCPDYLFIVDSVCVFRGEEKAPGNHFETRAL